MGLFALRSRLLVGGGWFSGEAAFGVGGVSGDRHK